MDIEFRTKKLAKTCNDWKQLQRAYGTDMAKKIRQRLDDLRAARTLADMTMLPGARCHELAGDREGELSVDLKQPYRLIFEPAHDPVPTKDDGGLDWSQITQIRVMEVTDTHE